MSESWAEWAARNGVTIKRCERCDHWQGRATRHCLEPGCKCPNHKGTLARSLTLFGIWVFAVAFAATFLIAFVAEVVAR